MADQVRESVILGALLHDIGKFWQRAGRKGNHSEAGVAFIDKFDALFPHDWLDDLRDMVGNHHARKVNKDVEKAVRVADRLASRERKIEPTIPKSNPNETPLMPIVSEVEFREERPRDWQQWGYNLHVLSLKEESIFPRLNVTVSSRDYLSLWEKFEEELGNLNLKSKGGFEYSDFVTILALLRKYTSLMPSATPWEKDEEYRTMPDISLYDHLKVTAAVGACLCRIAPDDIENLHKQDGDTEERLPVARILRADFSGIQKFLYRITRAEPTAEFRSTAKRLRGRSFYLSLLADVTADWFVRELKLSPANILFCGGGRFDLLIGADQVTKEKLDELGYRLQNWLMKEFYGEMGMQFASVDMLTRDFENLERVLILLDEKLAHSKQRKFRRNLQERDIFVDAKPLLDVCNFCGVTPRQDKTEKWEEGMCQHCRLQRQIGGRIPITDSIAHVYGHLPTEGKTTIDLQEPFGVTVFLLKKDEVREFIRDVGKAKLQVALYRLNDTDFLVENCPLNVAEGFRFLGNSAPVAQENLEPNLVASGKDQINKGELLDFEEVAFLSQGANLLGVAKADVDYLGQVFGSGLKSPSISRIATLSSAFDVFFGGWINLICDELVSNWNNNKNNNNPLKGKVESLFYIVYSGGDDLLVLGPWDGVIDFAQKLNSDFHGFTCHNDNITLSAGVLLVKPHFPIQRFAQLTGEQLEVSKTGGDQKNRSGVNPKDCITLFGETVRWHSSESDFDVLLEFGKNLAQYVLDKKVPRSFIYFLMNLYDQYFLENRDENPMWIPNFHYALARRISRKILEDNKLDLQANIARMMRYIRIPTSYVSLKIRRE